MSEQGNAVTAPFWAALSAGVLTVPSCDECGRTFFPPVIVCTHCAGSWKWGEATGRGVVYSFSVVHRHDTLPTPWVLAVVRLECGPLFLTRLVGIDPGAVEVGLEVVLQPTSDGDGTLVPTFGPATPEVVSR